MGNRKILEMKLGKPDLPAMFLLQLVKELAYIVVSEKQKNPTRTTGQRKLCCIDLCEAAAIKRASNYPITLASISSKTV